MEGRMEYYFLSCSEKSGFGFHDKVTFGSLPFKDYSSKICFPTFLLPRVVMRKVTRHNYVVSPLSSFVNLTLGDDQARIINRQPPPRLQSPSFSTSPLRKYHSSLFTSLLLPLHLAIRPRDSRGRLWSSNVGLVLRYDLCC